MLLKQVRNFKTFHSVGSLLFWALFAVHSGASSNSFAAENVECVPLETIFEQIETSLVLGDMSLAKVVLPEIEQNTNVYFSASPKIGIFFIERNIRILENIKRVTYSFIPETTWFSDLGVNYGRYGRLLKKLGREAEANEAFQKAIKASQNAGEKYESLNMYLSFLEKLDAAYLKYFRSREDKIEHPFGALSQQRSLE